MGRVSVYTMKREKPLFPRPVRDKVVMGRVRQGLKKSMDEVHVDPPGPIGFTRYLTDNDDT
jgi:hypothetical protein